MAQAFNTFYAGSGMKRTRSCLEGFGSAADRLARTQSPQSVAFLRRFSQPCDPNEALPPSIARERTSMARGRQHRSGCYRTTIGLFLGPLLHVFKRRARSRRADAFADGTALCSSLLAARGS